MAPRKKRKYLTVNSSDGEKRRIEIVQALKRPDSSAIAFQVSVKNGKAIVAFNPSVIDASRTECLRIDRRSDGKMLIATGTDGTEKSFRVTRAYKRPENSDIAFQIDVTDGEAIVSFTDTLIDATKIDSICIDRG